jgi:hypothetical protein
VDLVSEQKCKELAVSYEPRFLVALPYSCMVVLTIFVTQNALYRFRITLQLQQRGNWRKLEVVEAEMEENESVVFLLERKQGKITGNSNLW